MEVLTSAAGKFSSIFYIGERKAGPYNNWFINANLRFSAGRLADIGKLLALEEECLNAKLHISPSSSSSCRPAGVRGF